MKPTSPSEHEAIQNTKFADHDYFVIAGITDLAKIRDEAYRRTQYAPPESVMIHYHRLEEKCYWPKPGNPLDSTGAFQKHEVFGELK